MLNCFFFGVILNYKMIAKFYTWYINFLPRFCKKSCVCVCVPMFSQRFKRSRFMSRLLIRGVTRLHFQEYCPYKNYKAFWPTPLITQRPLSYALAWWVPHVTEI